MIRNHSKALLSRSAVTQKSFTRVSRRNLDAIRSLSTSDEPFYGSPRPPTTNKNRLPHQKIALAIHHATTAFADPTRADAVAGLGEVTGQVSLERIHEQMMADPTGRRILEDRPVVRKATIPYQELIDSVPEDPDAPLTFGQAYGKFLKSHGFDPDGRDPVKYIEDDTLAYIMLRYRQNHDFWHAITGLPPTVLGELGLKYLELFQTGLPIAALSSTFGALRLNSKERAVLMDQYLPWALEASQSSSPLMTVYYEEEFDTPLADLQNRLNLKPSPEVDL
ncbi:MAG: hypothetical protein SGBAC_000176 [Bacillariaceae sp.]